MGVFPIRQHTKKLLITLLLSASFLVIYWGTLQIVHDKISFSHPSGFYDDSFELKIRCGVLYEIYYTMDGSEPTTESIQYQRGTALTVTDATSNPNQYTTRTEISVGYDQQQLDENGFTHWNYAVPTQNVDKCTVIRAAAFYKGERVGESVCSVYFVGWENRSDYQDAYIVSLTADPDDLFGYENGIMVTGQILDRHVEQMKEKQQLESRWWWWKANYHNTGAEWERTANIIVFDQNREKEMDQTCGIRIHGGASRALPLKSIRCYARSEYAGADAFEVDWFGEEIQPSKFILYSGGNDSGGGSVSVNIKDYMIGQLGKEFKFATMDSFPCALFINGEFWGLYHISEHYNTKYIADHYSVHENNVLMIKNGEVAEGSTSDKQLYDDMKQKLTDLDMRREDNYRVACDLIDIDSCIDYYAFLIYIARTGDWPNGNYALWRTIEQENSIYGDSKWRWMLFDVNSAGMATASTTLLEDDTLQMVLDVDPLFASLFQNQEFQKAFAERIMYIGNTALSSERCSSFIDTFFADFSGLQQKSNIHVYNNSNEELLVVYKENLKQFFAGRCDVVRQLLEKHLDPEIAASLE